MHYRRLLSSHSAVQTRALERDKREEEDKIVYLQYRSVVVKSQNNAR